MGMKSKGLSSQTDQGSNVGSTTTLDNCMSLSFICKTRLCQVSVSGWLLARQLSLAGWLAEQRHDERCREEVLEEPALCSPAVGARTSSVLCSSQPCLFCGAPTTDSLECKTQARQETSQGLSERAYILHIRREKKSNSMRTLIS